MADDAIIVKESLRLHVVLHVFNKTMAKARHDYVIRSPLYH